MVRRIFTFILVLACVSSARADFTVDNANEVDTAQLEDVITRQAVESFGFTGTLKCAGDGEGFAIVFLDARYHKKDELPTIDRYEEPNIVRSIAFGFDTSNPATTDPFDANGNIEDRLQREVSIHVNGVELANRMAIDFAKDEEIAIAIDVKFVLGGAEVTCKLGETLVYDRFFLPDVEPIAPRLLLGASVGSGAISLTKTDFVIGDAAPDFPQPMRVILFDKQLVSSNESREPRSLVEFGIVPKDIGRVIATLKLEAPKDGFDPYDRRGAIYLVNENRQRFEIMRFMTPFSRDGQWKIDVTDFLPLFTDQKSFVCFIDTWQKGFLASVYLDFYPGKPERMPISVVNLWQGEPIMGDSNMPIENFFDEKTVLVPEGAKSARVRIMATGHGQEPNTNNAAEFMEIQRTLTVNDKSYDNTLWKTDNYLNPCRPQKGTWKYDRAGWAPGSVVEPWLIDITKQIDAHDLTLDYKLAPYKNESTDVGNPPIHWIESQVIFYDK